MSRIAVVPGSFDPITLGHLDVIERAKGIFDEVHVLVVHNPDKDAFLPVVEREMLIRQALEERGIESGVEVKNWSVGLLVDYLQQVGSRVIVKGLRSNVDLAYETPMSIVNRDLAHVETVFLLTSPENAHVSSSLVRQVSQLGGDISPYVPRAVATFLQRHKTSAP
ncbi:pantetheine-phosphate adenylyltransferase [Agrococcus casei]|uniref:Phosphopantetheine adenylyltransferase n=1 Tax=Agrococcus casei LMG 22410 TaxID=1255656 RepID=A0A1R4G2F2_9MICO|nr:pantetheine-phosphate adenylyltransferase [Agrococcus casei]SJM62346.1 Phosphopantetheine adenylyltransferase [Agrococcus casei LMG 22410]